VALRQVGYDVLPLVPLAPVDHGLGTEDGLDGLPEALGPVEDTEEAPVIADAPLHQLPEEGGAHLLVLRGRLDETEEHLLAGQPNPQGNDHRILGKGLPIQEQSEELLLGSWPRIVNFSFAMSGLDSWEIEE